MSRLNITNTVLSKRKLLKLVNNGYMHGWDDARMPTIKGLRRRGYNAAILNAFCRDIGVTRNFNVVQYERLAAHARNHLNEVAPRVMAVLRPLKIVLTGRDFTTHPLTVTALDFPFDAARGNHTITLNENALYIDATDFRTEDTADYYGLAPNKLVNLKYLGFRILCEHVEYDAEHKPVSLTCHVLTEEERGSEKPKGTIQWVPFSTAISFEARIYNNLFLVEEPNDETWEAELNPDSEVVVKNALIDPSVVNVLVLEKHVQFERIGYFVLDKDSVVNTTSPAASKIVYTMTVGLKESKPVEKPKEGEKGGINRSRKEEQEKQAAEKLAKMNVDPTEMYKSSPLYSLFDVDGIPTHDAKGEPISKSSFKKLRKDWEKQKQLFESNKK